MDSTTTALQGKADTSARVKLTKRAADAATAGRNAQGNPTAKVYWDAELPWFGLMVNPPNSSGSSVKSFIVQRYVAGKSVRVTLGRYGIQTVEEARKAAVQALATMSAGVSPVEEKRRKQARGITLREAWALTKAGMVTKKASAATIEGYEKALELYLKKWLDRPLAEITRREVHDRHQKLAQEIAQGKYARSCWRDRAGCTGEGSANGAFRVFRAIYNRALRQHPELPGNPCINIDWFRAKPPRTAIHSTQLASWGKGVRETGNPVRRDYLLFALFTGLRRQSAAEVRWDDVDLAGRKLRVPKPKGGEERAFDLPLSDYLIELLERRQQENTEFFPGSPWAFPAWNRKGEIIHISEPRAEIEGVPFTIHDLRRTFVTVAESLEISAYAIKALVNHSQPRHDVTAGYMSVEIERLRAPMQQITDKLRVLIGDAPDADVISFSAAKVG